MKKDNNKKEIIRDWYLVDARNKILGRLATKSANILYGKSKKEFMPNMDSGDYVVIINAKYIKVTGKKMDNKVYFRHTGYPGGIKKQTLRELLDKKPEEAIRKAIKGMLPKNKLSMQALKRLKIYEDEKYQGNQNMKVLEID